MLGANPFFKVMEKTPVYRPTETGVNNTGTRPHVGHPRFGFQTMFHSKVLPLPTAPAIVGGNVDWTKSKVTPATLHLHNALTSVRPMSSAPALGSPLALSEPSRDSIHIQY
jgi:hypothetical protein